MGMPPRRGSKAYRDHQRERLIRLGVEGRQLVEQLVTDLIRCGNRPREAWRLARELTQDEVAARFNQIKGGPDSPMRGSRICQYEKWPMGGVRPSVRVLKILAAVYETTWDQLVDLDDLEKMPASDRLAFLDISDLRYGDSLGLPVPRQRHHPNAPHSSDDSPVNRPVTAEEPVAVGERLLVPSPESSPDAAEVRARLEELTVSAPAAPARTLPRDIGSFTGRKDEVRELMQAVSHRVASGGVVGIHAIEGMAGIGKTALAVHAAHQLASHFPDGQIFLRLHAHTPGQQPVDPAKALATLLLTIGLAPAQIPPGLPARELLWRDRLAGKKILLVLDDAAGPAQVNPLLPGTAESLVVITSRHRLAVDDAVSISLDTLTPAEAATLFLRVATRPDLAPTDAGVAEVTQLCGYLPLAIRLVARRLRRPSWALTEVAAELAAAQDRLAAIDAGQRAVAAAFELSYRDLAQDQRRVFRRLGLHPGNEIDAYATAALGQTSVAVARRHLEELEDLRLLDEPVRGRYRLHDLLRDYARTLAATDPPAECDAALDRLLDYYLHTATLAATHLTQRTPTTHPVLAHPPTSLPELTSREAALTWLETERANLHAATDHAAQHARYQHAIYLPAALHVLRVHDPWGHALTLHHTALDAAHTAGDRHGQAHALNDLGDVQYWTGDFPAATASLQQALALYRDLGDRDGQAHALNDLGRMQYRTGDYLAATANHQQALALFRDLGSRHGQASALNRLGCVQYRTGDYPAATASLQQALALYRDLGDRHGQASALNDLGNVQRVTGDYPAATASLQQALALYRDLGDRHGQAHALSYLGCVQQVTGDYPAATANHQRALALFRDLGSRLGEAKALNNLGRVLCASLAVADARAHHGQALGIARALAGVSPLF
jgi:tetratricopeptide (TPR) repeat protein/transcriptional regulator with XRE-family HTH domain